MAQLSQYHGVRVQTFHRWRHQYGAIEPEEARKLKEMEHESARLKRLVAEEELDISIL